MYRTLVTATATLLTLNLCSTPFEYAYEREEKIKPQLVAYNSPYRIAKTVDPSGRSLEMDDCSIWAIASGSHREVSSWLKNDPLIIYPCLCPGWYGGSFWIFNERLGSYACADLSLGPTIHGECTNHIVRIDYYRGEVLLRDARGYQNLWKVSLQDLYLITSWRVDDVVIIGSNKSSTAQWVDLSDYILINVAENMYVRSNIIY